MSSQSEMKKGMLAVLCCTIIASGMVTHGFFVGKGIRESQPWHHLADPLGLLRNIDVPESLNLGFKAESDAEGGGFTFKFIIDEQAYRGRISGSEGTDKASGQITIDEIEVSEYWKD